MKKIAVIPARAGSKGLKDKNIVDLCGKPLMVYTIEAAIDSCCFERVIVSTDSKAYGDIAESSGADVIYRGEDASNDAASTYMVLEDLFGKIPLFFEYFVLLQPTSPLRTSAHIREAVEVFEERYNEFDFLVSVKESEHPKVLVNPIDEDRSLKYFDTDFSNYRRQTFKDYSPNGAIYIGKYDAYMKKRHFFGKNTLAYIINKNDSVDIDDEIDYQLARLLIQRQN